MKKPVLAYDSPTHYENETGLRLPFRREGCKFVLPRSGGLAADAALADDVLVPRRPLSQTDAERAEFEAMFPPRQPAEVR